MNKILYVLRRPVTEIDQSLFVPSEPGDEVVLLPESNSSVLSLRHETATAPEGDTAVYDELIEKVFLCDRVIVI